MKELNTIQCALHSPKSQNNQFGGYKYRSLEDILESVKPLLKDTGCTITFSDEIQLVGSRYYVHTTCTIKNASGETESSTACAREQETKKGMDEAQITGSASSYARKYAVCSLLAIDNNQEPDMMDNRNEGTRSSRSNAPLKCDQETYNKFVVDQAKKLFYTDPDTGKGITPRDWYIKYYRPSKLDLEAFDHASASFDNNHNSQ